MMYSPRNQTGFTLLELLLVIFLLGLMAMTTFAVVQDDDDQQRFEATKTYYQLIKKAIVGDPTLTLNGETDVSGFVADMGRLPNCLRELLDENGCDGVADSADDLPAWTQDEDSQVWAGWRGPYLQGIPESGGLAFRDGWKNEGGATNLDVSNYGWLFGIGATNSVACRASSVAQSEPNTLYLQSCGSDAAVGGSDYGQDYPYSYLVDHDNDPNTPMVSRPPKLVSDSDHRVELGSEWDSVAVQFFGGSASTTIPANSLRLRLNYPVDGEMLTWSDTALDTVAERDAAPFLSDKFPSVNLPMVDVASKTVNISVASTLTANKLSIPNDAVLTLALGAASETQLSLVDCPCEIAVTNPTTPPGTVISIDFGVGATMTVPLHQTRVTVTGLPKPTSVAMGKRTITIVCEASGKNFDGNCNDDANANGYNPVATPYSFTVKPRASFTPPNVLRWQVN